MSILILTDSPSTAETSLVINELRSRGIPTTSLAPWDISMPFPLFEADLAYVPCNLLHRGSTFELIHRLLILREVERQVGTVINPVESMLRYSKEELTIQLTRIGLPTPKTIATENIEEAYRFAAEYLDSGREVVLKPLCRGRGVGVIKLSGIRSRKDLLQFLVWYTRAHAEGVYYLQEYIPNHGYDVRLFVVDGEVVGREKRSNPSDFRYNISLGGLAEPFNNPVYDELSIRVADAVGFKVAGIDILPGLDGRPYVLEANCYPGYTGLIEATGIPIHKRIVDYLQRLLKR